MKNVSYLIFPHQYSGEETLEDRKEYGLSKIFLATSAGSQIDKPKVSTRVTATITLNLNFFSTLTDTLRGKYLSAV